MGAELYARLAELPVTIEAVETETLSQQAGSWTRLTSVVRLRGEGQQGLGEDVTWEAVDHRQLARAQAAGALDWGLTGRWTLGSLSEALDGRELFPRGAKREVSRRYRRWAVESAAADLGLKQAGLSLAALWQRPLAPLRFVASLGLRAPQGFARLHALLERAPAVRLKLDADESWDEAVIAELAALDRVVTVDIKGHYAGTAVEQPVDLERLRRIVAGLPEAWVEDPWIEAAALVPAERLSWDAPAHSAQALTELPPARGLNIKPSRYGSWRALLEAYEDAWARGLTIYGGGQSELGPGRAQIQTLAALLHPEAPNDVAPTDFNLRPLPERLAPAPLNLTERPGFGAAAVKAE